jgi:hypothetical protein
MAPSPARSRLTLRSLHRGIGFNRGDTVNDEPHYQRASERISPEKVVAVLVSAAALAFSVGSAAMAVYDRILDDVGELHRSIDVLETRIEAYYRERSPYVDRLLDVERKQAAALDRLGVLSERLVRCERDEKRP